MSDMFADTLNVDTVRAHDNVNNINNNSAAESTPNCPKPTHSDVIISEANTPALSKCTKVSPPGMVQNENLARTPVPRRISVDCIPEEIVPSSLDSREYNDSSVKNESSTPAKDARNGHGRLDSGVDCGSNRNSMIEEPDDLSTSTGAESCPAQHPPSTSPPKSPSRPSNIALPAVACTPSPVLTQSSCPSGSEGCCTQPRQRRHSRPQSPTGPLYPSPPLSPSCHAELTDARSRSRSIAAVNDYTSVRLAAELKKAQHDLKLRDEECDKLLQVRDQMERELTELTAGLFEEANKMVEEANLGQAHAQKLLEEANHKISVLEPELAVLKDLVLTSTPSAPNRQLHPQLLGRPTSISPRPKNKQTQAAHKRSVSSSSAHALPGGARGVNSGGVGDNGVFGNGFRNGPDSSSVNGHHEEDWRRDEKSKIKSGMRVLVNALPTGIAYPLSAPPGCRSPPRSRFPPAGSNIKRLQSVPAADHIQRSVGLNDPSREVDPLVYAEFSEWKSTTELSLVQAECSFLMRILREDILPCLNFTNSQLSEEVLENISTNTLTIEPMLGPTAGLHPKKCDLTESMTLCRYKMKFGDQDDYAHSVSESVRNKIAAVCDLYCYLRYIRQGLVKSSDIDMYWEITRLRKKVNLVRLGYFSEQEG